MHANAFLSYCLQDVNFISGQAVRIFGIAWSLLLVLVESEMKVVRKYVPLLDVWVARGVVHLFMAALTFREAYPADEATDFQKSLQLYRFVASGALAVCGTIYIAGGVLCLGAIRRARERREERYVQAQVEYDRLERRRRELQHLLGREL